MSRTIRLAAALLVATAAIQPAVAQKKSAPSVKGMQSGVNSLMDDLEYLLSLTSPKEQKQWDVLKGNVDIFFGGLDRTKPLRLDVLLDGGTTRFRPSFPIKSLKNFRDNLDAFGWVSRRKTSSYYGLKLKGDPLLFLRYKNRYATISVKKEDVPSKLADPKIGIKSLLDKKFDVGAEIQNTDVTAEGLQARRDSFAKVEKELLAAIKKKRGEDAQTFDIRKLLSTQQLKEAERFFVEASQMTIGWTTDVAAKEGRLDIDVTAIPGTELDQGIALLGTTVSDFANVPRAKGSILSLRLNHALDPMRKAHLLSLFALVRAKAKGKIDGSDKLQPGEKTNSKQMADLFFTMLVDGTQMGVVDGFLEVTTNGAGQTTMVGGLKSPDGKAADAMLKLIPQARLGQTAKMDVATQGDVAIHEVSIPDEVQNNFQLLLGNNTTMYVGTAKNSIWCAVGQDALVALKAAIVETAKPNTGKAGTFVDLYVKAGPWVDLRNQRLGKEGDPEMRKLAMEAFKPGGDAVTFNLERVEKRVVGKLSVQTGILRFAGKVVAKVCKEQLPQD